MKLDLKRYDTPDCNCPYCGHHLDRISVADGPPEPGDYTFCVICGSLLILDERLEVLKPTEEQIAKLKASMEWRAIEIIQREIRLVARQFAERN